MTAVDVHFDFVDNVKTVEVAVVMTQDFEVLMKETKTVKKVEGYNLFNYTLEGLKFALDLLEEDLLEEVMLKNQHAFIFDWLRNESYGDKYEEQYGYIMKKMMKQVHEGCTFGFEVISGKENKCKKLLKAKKVKKPVTSGGDLTGLFGGRAKEEHESNVIDFLQSRKKA